MEALKKCERCGKLAYESETVTITVSELEALKKAAAREAGRKVIPKYRLVSRSSIARNPEQAGFIIENLPTKTITEIRSAMVEQFGAEAPSRSSIYRFVEATKRLGG